MLCADMEKLESELDDIVIALENPQLTVVERAALELAYERLSLRMWKHHESGHRGSPCYEPPYEE